MQNTFDADAFALRKLKLNGVEYNFRPASIRLNNEYLIPVVQKKMDEAKDENERYTIMIEVILRIISDIPECDLWDVSMPVLVRTYYYAVNGLPPEEEKNS